MNSRKLALVVAMAALLNAMAIGGYVFVSPGAQAAEENYMHILGKPVTPPPTPPAQQVPWGIVKIKADRVWPSTTGASINVAVIDTGIDMDHPDLAANIKGGVNFVPTAKSWNDDNGHGTHVAGTIAAQNNALGVVGVGPSIGLWGVKVLDRRGSGSYDWIVKGINWATATHSDANPANDINVISMSLGGPVGTAALEAAVNAAYTHGITIVVAAGNDGDGNTGTVEMSYPAAYPNVIAVAATDSADAAPSWSNTGPFVDVCAPGVSVYSTFKDGGYTTYSGTSMATPHVSGTVALMLTTPVGASDANGNGAWDPAEVQNKLQSTAMDLGPAGADMQYGCGLIDAYAACA